MKLVKKGRIELNLEVMARTDHVSIWLPDSLHIFGVCYSDQVYIEDFMWQEFSYPEKAVVKEDRASVIL